MTLPIPKKPQDVLNILQTAVKTNLPNANPQLRNSWLYTVLTAIATLGYDLYQAIDYASTQMFPTTASGKYLINFGEGFNVYLQPASHAIGNIVVTGTNATTIPSNTSLTAGTGQVYTTSNTVSITNNTVQVSTMTRNANVIYVVTSSSISFATGQSIAIQGAQETDYNGNHEIVVTGNHSFTYAIDKTPSSPASGTITANSNSISIPIISKDVGSNQNLQSGSELNLDSPIVGVDNTAYVTYGTLGGGSDIETEDNYRKRILHRLQNYYGQFNKAIVEDTVLGITGNTRVWVQSVDDLEVTQDIVMATNTNRIAILETMHNHGLENGQEIQVTGAVQSAYNMKTNAVVLDDTHIIYVLDVTAPSPATGTIKLQTPLSSLGSVRIYFVRDNDGNGTDILPDNSEVQTTKNSIMKLAPVDLSEIDVVIQAPNPVLMDVIFSSITPDTSSIKTATKDNLIAGFKGQTNVGADIPLSFIESIAYNTVDDRGNKVQGFTLQSPVTKTSVALNELAILHSVTFT